jgi:hypothetical protein
MRLTDRTRLIPALLVVALTFATVYVQYRGLLVDSGGRDPQQFIEVDLRERHDAIIDHTQGDPWRYRLLSEWGAEAALRAADAVGFSKPAVVGFLGFRVLQNLVIFALMWLYLRKLGIGWFESLLGLGLLAWGFTQALHHQAMSFNTYGDIAFYLATALLILNRRWWWIVPLTVAAAVNRETSGLIPVMLLAVAVAHGVRTDDGRRALRFGVAALVAFGVTYGIVRLAVGSSYLILANGRHPGTELLEYNVARGITWDHAFQTLNVVPLLALAAVRSWPRELKALGIAVAPAWLLIHVFSGVLAESRLLLVPMAVVFVPGLLAGLRARR